LAELPFLANYFTPATVPGFTHYTIALFHLPDASIAWHRLTMPRYFGSVDDDYQPAADRIRNFRISARRRNKMAQDTTISCRQ
jgi:hypothetical protein